MSKDLGSRKMPTMITLLYVLGGDLYWQSQNTLALRSHDDSYRKDLSTPMYLASNGATGECSFPKDSLIMRGAASVMLCCLVRRFQHLIPGFNNAKFKVLISYYFRRLPLFLWSCEDEH